MPLYDYRCGECAHEFEVLQGISDSPLTSCPECKEDTLKKLASAPAFTFKGGGWYKDGYGSSNAKPSGAAAASSGTKSETTSKPDTSAKPASTPKPTTSK